MKETNWRSVTTDPPQEQVYILIKTKTGLVRVARRFVYPNNEEVFSYSSTYYKDVIWWQPLPE